MSTLPKQLAWRALSLVPQRLQEGPGYRSWFAFLQDNAQWSAEQIEAWQLERLRGIIRFATQNTEGYRELYQKAGVNALDLRTTADVRLLPFTTKQLFQSNLEAFSVQRLRRKYSTTGGSTGLPFGFYQTPGMRAVERAFVHNAWSQFGWTPGARTAILRGGFVGTKAKPWLYDPYRRELNLSTYYLSKESLPAYASAVSLHGIEVLQAYPSALHIFSDLLQETGVAASFPFRTILLASENSYDWQLRKAAEVFPSATIFDFYGQSERVIFAAWCKQSRAYHANPFYGITELVDGELVGTSFHNRGTPFLRYRTMDTAEEGAAHCTACGRNWRLLPRILGRQHELIVTATGRHISMTALNMHDRLFDPILQFQFMQERAGEVIFRYLPRCPLAPAQVERMRVGLAAKLGSDVKLAMQPVTGIERTKAGKFRFLDQRMALQYGDANAA